MNGPSVSFTAVDMTFHNILCSTAARQHPAHRPQFPDDGGARDESIVLDAVLRAVQALFTTHGFQSEHGRQTVEKAD